MQNDRLRTDDGEISVPPAHDAELRARLRSLAHVRRRFGYRRLHVLLRREGFTVNHKRLFRLYREERLMVRRRGGRKRALGTRAPMLVPQWPNDRWSLDFVADQFIVSDSPIPLFRWLDFFVGLSANASRPRDYAARRSAERCAAQRHGMSSSRRDAGQRLTSFVSTSAK